MQAETQPSSGQLLTPLSPPPPGCTLKPIDTTIKRLRSLDFLRGLGILGIVYLHFALYNYAGLLEIDFDNPPLVITVIGFLLTWAGLFAIVSGAAFAFTGYRRFLKGRHDYSRVSGSFLAAGATLLVVHYLCFALLGPTLLDLEAGAHEYSVVVGLFTTGRLTVPSFARIFYNTSLSMFGWNLLLTGVFLRIVLSGKSARKPGRLAMISAVVGLVVMAMSALRIPLFPLIEATGRCWDSASSWAKTIQSSPTSVSV